MRRVSPLVVAFLIVIGSPVRAERARSGGGVAVTVVKDRCGANVREKPPGDVAVRARPTSGGEIRLDVSEYVYYCDPGPRFAATAAAGRLLIVPEPLPENSRRSNCACAHRLRLRVRGIDSGDWEVRVDTGKTEPKLGPDGWVEEKIEAVTKVTVR